MKNHYYKLNNKLINALKNNKAVIDFEEEGISESTNKIFDYETGKFVLIDKVFKVLYYSNGGNKSKINEIDLKNKNFTELLKKNLFKGEYDFHIDNYKEKLLYGKELPSIVNAKIFNDTLYINYRLNFVKNIFLVHDKK